MPGDGNCLVKAPHHGQEVRVREVGVWAVRVQLEGSAELAFGAGPVPIVEELRISQGCMRLGEGVVELQDGAAEPGKQLSAVVLAFTRKSGEHDQLFGSVTSSDIARQLEAKGFNTDRRKIELDVPLKTVGEFMVPIKLHREVTATIKVTVSKEAVAAEAPAAEETKAEA